MTLFSSKRSLLRTLGWCAVASVVLAGVDGHAPLRGADEPRLLWVADGEEEKPGLPAPFRRAIENFFGPKERVKPAEQSSEEGDARLRDRTDARAPYDRTMSTRLERAERYLDRGDERSAIDLLQSILDARKDALVYSKRHFMPAHVAANQLLGRLSEDGLRDYELRYGREAQHLLDEATVQNDQSLLAATAIRFLHTRAGRIAAERLGTLHLDRGRYALALLWFERLAGVRRAVPRDDSLAMKASLARRLSGGQSPSALLPEPSAEAQESLAARRLDAVEVALRSRNEPLENWLNLQGNASRRGISMTGEPLLMSRWEIPLTTSSALQPEILDLIETLNEEGRAAIPVATPVTVGGLVAFRTFRGVKVVDAVSGDVHWETRAGVPAERILLDMIRRSRGNHVIVPGSSNMADKLPHASLIYRDATWGLLSSDGQRLFVVEEHAVLPPIVNSYRFAGTPSAQDRYGRDWNTNRLVAYDLRTGRVLWEVGGTELQETFDLPLSGMSFMGPPVADGGDLFVVGESGNEVRLCVLDAATGSQKWSRLLGYSDVTLDRDIVRRFWSAQVAVADGAVVCPTTLGWLIAVERVSGRLLWAHRYAGRDARNRSGRVARSSRPPVNDLRNLNARWHPSAPLIVNGRVIHAPAEQPVLECLDLITGDKIWSVPKNDHLLLSGVVDQNLILVGKESVEALAVEDGGRTWKAKLQGLPAGRGLITNERFLLSLSSGKIVEFSTTNGKKLREYASQVLQSKPGNLVMHGGQLFSQSPLGLTAFEERNAFYADLDKDAANGQTLLKRARARLAENDFSLALEALDNIEVAGLGGGERRLHRRLVQQTLNGLIQARPDDAGNAFSRLSDLAKTRAERLSLLRLRYERLRTLEQTEDALHTLLKLADSVTSDDEFFERTDNDRVKVRPLAWIAGQIVDLHAQNAEVVQTVLEREVSVLADEKPSARQRFIELMTPVGLAIEGDSRLTRFIAAQANSFAKSRRFSEAEHLHMRLERSADDGVANRALAHRADLLDAMQLNTDARRARAAMPNASSETATERVAVDFGWGNPRWAMKRMGSQYTNRIRTRDLLVGEFSSQVFDATRLEFDTNDGRVNLVSNDDDTLVWSVPIPNFRANLRVQASVIGTRLIVQCAETVTCLSLVERRILWTRRIPDAVTQSSNYVSFGTGWWGADKGDLTAVGRRDSGQALAAVNNDYICFRGRRQLHVLDTATGRERFQVPSTSSPIPRVRGTSEVLLVERSKKDILALRATDGKELALRLPNDAFANTLATAGKNLILGARRSSFFGLGRGQSAVRAVNPVSGKVVWKQEVPGDWFALIDPSHLGIISKDGTVRSLDFRTGRITRLAKLERESFAKAISAHIVADRHCLYVLVRDRRSGITQNSTLPAVSVNGHIVAIDRHTGNQLWQAYPGAGSLLLEHLAGSPLLIVSNRTILPRPDHSTWQTTLMGIDKRTGEVVAQHQSALSNNYTSVRLNASDRYIEVRAYNQRLRMHATDVAADDGLGAIPADLPLPESMAVSP